jgi:transcriptional regulator with XRE-family HTH domain
MSANAPAPSGQSQPGDDREALGTSAGATLAERIDSLFRNVHPGRRKPYSIREVADEINAAAGEQVISHSYLWSLRKGVKTNPSMIQIAALAGFFKVSPLYFYDVPGEPPLDPAAQLALSDSAVREIAMRASGLPEPALRALTDMADAARELAGLPPVIDQADSGTTADS